MYKKSHQVHTCVATKDVVENMSYEIANNANSYIIQFFKSLTRGVSHCGLAIYIQKSV
jgi:hypothetical protein